ncbi:hypothetical protein ACPSL3_11705 [Vibrio owensii]|uniref:hypothetical protein n=1 Tax=Vibrio TaxID=662 RepID=UPI00039A3C0F|nr:MULTISPECIES: hypothetical protein [Vibrio]EHR5466014.1 hypothetical protein [Vibrio parahaemolyticus]KIF45630.1 hypothetical protein M445_20020 [Vibrio owensii 47666-1]MCF6451288.1 hypothetical protein [Vibrio sp. MMG023]
MKINFFQLDTDLQDEWDATLNEPLLVMVDTESKDIPYTGEFVVLPVGTFLYKVIKIIRKVNEVTEGHFATTEIDIVLTPALID